MTGISPLDPGFLRIVTNRRALSSPLPPAAPLAQVRAWLARPQPESGRPGFAGARDVGRMASLGSGPSTWGSAEDGALAQIAAFLGRREQEPRQVAARDGEPPRCP